MGNTPPTKEEVLVDKRVVEFLRNANSGNKQPQKKKATDVPQRCLDVLVVGMERSGKSTICKQFEYILQVGNVEQVIDAKEIAQHVVGSMQSLIQTIKKDFPEIVLAEPANQILELKVAEISRISNGLRRILEEVWSDPFIQQNFVRRTGLLSGPVSDSNLNYFIENLTRICGEGYSPTFDDALRAYKPTPENGQELRLDFNEMQQLRFVEMSSRNALDISWQWQFLQCELVLYVVSLGNCDQYIPQGSVNMLQDSLKVFEELLLDRFLVKKPIVLFFNRLDLFEQRFQDDKGYLRNVFPDIEADNFATSKAALKFIKGKFREKNTDSSRHVQVIAGNASDTGDVQTLLEEILNHLSDKLSQGRVSL